MKDAWAFEGLGDDQASRRGFFAAQDFHGSSFPTERLTETRTCSPQSPSEKHAKGSSPTESDARRATKTGKED